MATEDFYEVERIVDKRKNRKGRTEYLVRWRGYGCEGDTWEPESHLTTCMVYVHDFNRQYAQQRRDATLLRSTRSYPFGPPAGLGQLRPAAGPDPLSASRPAPAHLAAAAGLKGTACPTTAPPMSVPPVGPARRSLDLAKSGIKILVPRSPMNTLLQSPSEAASSEAAHGTDAGARDAHGVPPEVALEQPTDVQPGPGQLRARMGIRSRSHNTPPATLAAVRSLSGAGASGTTEDVGAGGRPAVNVATCAPAKRRPEEHGAFDKRLRFSVRQTESAYRYRDIVVKKQDGFTHILLSSKSSENNALNPEVMKEIQSAMATAASDDSKLVLLGAVGSVFCRGLDFLYFVKRLTDDRKKESIKMAETIRTFVNTFIQFRKPIVAAVNGPALGLGAAILPLCDVVWANEKAWFQTPYAEYGQTPDACSSFTFPRIMGPPSANELLLSGRKLTAQEACSKGLVSQVLWPGTFAQEVMLRVKELVAVDSLVLRESKALMRNSSRSSLEQTNERECEALKRIWGSSQGTDAILQHLQRSRELY
ncbi:chromodomain Y-like protein [Syngnathoides biaculeatus]|uniref:chromodomain Y-like protein n=1 Tax=Syngnathoides biaculeatus TaxID=300417 RepID=UPI002ADD794D|nr:chromodomain Y-like protein [Syngnathoides biaculeatus]